MESKDHGSVHQTDTYSLYETGLRQLLSRMGLDQSRRSEALVYQQRLIENITQSRQYGDTDTRKAERSEIIVQLNELALSALGISFSELCGLSTPTINQRPGERLQDYIVQRINQAIENHRRSTADLLSKLSMGEDPDLRRQIEWREREIQRLEKLLQENLSLAEPDQVAGLQSNECAPFEFINREEELTYFSAVDAPQYIVLNAPSRYGKTALLEKLGKKLEALEWNCVYVPVIQGATVRDLAICIAETLVGTADGLGTATAPERLGQQLALLVEQNIRFERTRSDGQIVLCPGIVLLFDFEYPTLTFSAGRFVTADELVDGLIASFESALRDHLPCFAGGGSRLRVVIAGRRIVDWAQSRKLPLSPICLTPFTFRVVYLSVKAMWPRRRDAWCQDVAALLMHYTAGHPGCLAKIADCYAQAGCPRPDRFFIREPHEYGWQSLVLEAVSATHSCIPEAQRRVFETMSVFRVSDYHILNTLIGNTQESLLADPTSSLISWQGTAVQLGDTLSRTQLLRWQHRLLRDDITRRMLVLGIRMTASDEYIKLCRIAREIYDAYLQLNGTAGDPEIWFIEALYEELQCHIFEIESVENRTALRRRFLEELVPEYLQKLIEGREAAQERVHLKAALEEDWEFQFAVNFFLRGRSFSDEPCKAFLRVVSDYFERQAT